MAAKIPLPDLVGAANTQTGLNRNAAFDVAGANRYGQVGPEGSSNQWITDPATGQVTNQTTMGAQPQAMYNALMGNSGNNLASFQQQYWGDGAGGVTGAGGAGTGGGVNFNMTAGGAGGGMIPGDIQKDLDYSKLTAMPTTDPAAARQEAQDALYKRSAGYLDPQWQESQRSTETQLANKGLVPGTPAYDRAYANLQRAKESAYTGARQDAIAGGGAEAARAQEMALQLRNQGITEAGNLGAFHNAAQGQGADQYLTQRGQDVGSATTLGAAGISAGASQANAALQNQAAMARLGLDTRQQQYAELMGMGKQAQDFLPQFGISQGNVGAYKPGDIQGATQAQYENALAKQKAKKPGLLGSLLPIAGTVLGSFAGPLGTAAGGALGSYLGKSVSGGAAP